MRSFIFVAACLILLHIPKLACANILYVASFPSNTIGEYDTSTGATINSSFISGLTYPTGLAVDGSGDLYVTNYNGYNGFVGVYNATIGTTINASLISGLSFPVGVALGGSGNLYVANFAAD